MFPAARFTVLAAAVMASAPIFAQAPASAPARTTSAAHASSSSGKASNTMPAKASAPAVTGFSGTCMDGTTTTAASRGGACSGHGGVKDWYAAPVSRATTLATAAAGGHGQVWVNKDTKVYHCPGDQWHGKTQEGSYMSEAKAVAQGFHADHGKACGR